MILSFEDINTESIRKCEKVKPFPSEIQKITRLKLRMIKNAQSIQDLRIPPANRLEKLSSRLSRLYSIRKNDPWRIIFKWNKSKAELVKIIDYL